MAQFAFFLTYACCHVLTNAVLHSAGRPSQKEFSFAMPACPIAAFSGSKTIPVSLPSKDPLPVKISAKGTVSIFDETKTMQGQVTLDVTLS